MTLGNDLYYRVTVRAPGAEYDLSGDVASFLVEQQEDQPDLFSAKLADPFKVLGHAIQEGMEIEAELGTAGAHSVVFGGRIYNVDGSFPENAAPTLELRAHDASMAMGLRRRSRKLEGTLSSVVREVARPHFRAVDVRLRGDPDFGARGVRQADETDLALLLRLAREAFAVVYVEPPAKLCFRAQQDIMTTEPSITLSYGRTDVPHRLLSFHPNADARRARAPRVLSGVDFDEGVSIDAPPLAPSGAARIDDAAFDENLAALRSRDRKKAEALKDLIGAAPSARKALTAELDAVERDAVARPISRKALSERAKNQASTSLHGMRAHGTSLGNKDMRARSTVAVEDVGGRFSGVWYLSRVQHVIDARGFRTEFDCRR